MHQETSESEYLMPPTDNSFQGNSECSLQDESDKESIDSSSKDMMMTHTQG
jgi:hypothetical protein